jgi:hypothetical protein
VAAGDYREQVLVSGKALSIIAEDGATLSAPDTLTISFVNTASGTPNKFALLAVTNGGNVVIDNLDFAGSRPGRRRGRGRLQRRLLLQRERRRHQRHGKRHPRRRTRRRDQRRATRERRRGGGHRRRRGDGRGRGMTISGFQKTGIVANGAGLTVNIHDKRLSPAPAPPRRSRRTASRSAPGLPGVVDGNTITGIGWTGSSYSTAGVLVFGSPA